jgi:hypothetical protein
MRNVIASLVAVAGLSVAANADVNTLVDWEVSLDGINFSESVLVTSPGTLVHARATVTYTGTAQPLGLASMLFQPTVSNWQVGDAAQGFANNGAGGNTTTPSGAIADVAGSFGRISPWARTALTTTTAITNHVHNAGSGGAPAGTWLRIAQRQVTGWIGGTGNTTGGSGVPIAQLANVGRTTNDPAFNPALSVNVFRFGMMINAAGAARPDMLVDSPTAGFGNRNTTTGEREVYWWGDMNESSGSIRGTAVVDGAIITFVPTPASLALLGLGGLIVGRRRR